MTKTVFVTGGTGFIAGHILRELLDAGYTVRASLRDSARGPELRAALARYLRDAGAADRLDLVALDLEADTGWDEAMAGAHALVHTASPFPLSVPEDPDALIRPALEGTRRVLGAAQAAGVTRVVLTSSVAAVSRLDGPEIQDETQWADPDPAKVSPYTRSKILAERAAWDFVRDKAPEMALTAINPGLVFGPPLGGRFGSSIALVRRLMSGRDPMLPAYGLPVVDVRDVAAMHLRALERPESAGRRYIGSAGSLWFAEMGRILKARYPDRRIATRNAPNWLMRIVALFDPDVRSILPQLGHIERVSNLRARQELGITFTEPQTALIATADWLAEKGEV